MAMSMFGKAIHCDGTNTEETSVRNCVLSVFTDLSSFGQVQGLDIIIIMQRDCPNSLTIVKQIPCSSSLTLTVETFNPIMSS